MNDTLLILAAVYLSVGWLLSLVAVGFWRAGYSVSAVKPSWSQWRSRLWGVLVMTVAWGLFAGVCVIEEFGEDDF